MEKQRKEKVSEVVPKRQWHRKQVKAIFLLGDPDYDKPDYMIAADIGISDRTLRRWKRKPEFMKAVNELLDKNIKSVRPGVM